MSRSRNRSRNRKKQMRKTRAMRRLRTGAPGPHRDGAGHCAGQPQVRHLPRTRDLREELAVEDLVFHQPGGRRALCRCPEEVRERLALLPRRFGAAPAHQTESLLMR
eukprot:4369630-Pyramimonas_sp.AAC.1